MVAFNALAVSQLAFVSSFLEPPATVLRAFREALQNITCGPRFAFAHEQLVAGKRGGFLAAALDLRVYSLAARARQALRMAELDGMAEQLEDARRCEDAWLAALPEQWNDG
eukprot:9238518-Lingulodinium_polyedra.AAC.1